MDLKLLDRLFKNKKDKTNWSFYISLTALFISGATFFENNLKPFELDFKILDPTWFNYALVEKPNGKNLGILATIPLYNKGAQTGVVEDFMITLRNTNNDHKYFYIPTLVLNNSSPQPANTGLRDIDNLTIQSLNINLADRKGTFKTFQLKPHEARVEYILFVPVTPNNPEILPDGNFDYILSIFQNGNWKDLSKPMKIKSKSLEDIGWLQRDKNLKHISEKIMQYRGTSLNKNISIREY